MKRVRLKSMPPYRHKLIEICENKIREYIESYDGIIGDYRYNPDALNEQSVRFRVLKEAKGHCALCGESVKKSPIDIDHIIPRSKGGTNDFSNLQALCYRCNRAKRDTDKTDFRNYGKDSIESSCAFCKISDRVVKAHNTALWIDDGFPVTERHSLIIPKRHIASPFDLFVDELKDIFMLAQVAKREISKDDERVKGFNFGVNDGAIAGQTIFHAHWHLIPRRSGDVLNPKGGIRGIIPGKGSY